jgi:hypothetical protein
MFLLFYQQMFMCLLVFFVHVFVLPADVPFVLDVHPSRTHEYACDEYILEQLMEEVKKMQKKRLKTPSLKKGNPKFEFWISGPFAALGVCFHFRQLVFTCCT